jgi:hypothetical protein
MVNNEFRKKLFQQALGNVEESYRTSLPRTAISLDLLPYVLYVCRDSLS